MPILATQAITTALTNSLSTPVEGLGRLGGVSLIATFTYTSGGTTAKAYVQTSLDGGVTWQDIACFAFTTAGATKRGHISRQQALAIAVPTTGTMADDSMAQGYLGDRLRVAFTTTGTYASGTSLQVAYQAA
jgi:hypothetical protein